MKRFELGWVSSIALLLLAFAPAAQAQFRPNVLVVVLDDVGVENLSVYNPSVLRPPTPQLTQLANSGVRFTKAYANPVCSPTRAGIMTGRYSFRTGIGDVVGGLDQLPLSEVSLAELLKNGFPTLPQYRCGAFGKWHLTAQQMDEMHPIDQGFDNFVGPSGNVNDHFEWKLIRADALGWSQTLIGMPGGPCNENTYTASVVRREAVAWINAQTDPFFAYVCFNPPHSPYQVPPLTTLSVATQNTITGLGHAPGSRPNDDLAYDWMIESVDTQLGRLLSGITRAKLINTTILVIGDNGTPAPVIESPPYESTHAKGTVFEQGTLVPLIAAGRGVNSAGLACNGLVNTVDIWSTVASVTGAQLPAGVTIDGVSFRHMIHDPGAPSSRTQAFAQRYLPNVAYVPDPLVPPALGEHNRAMTDGRFKYLRLRTEELVEMAFDLSTDPLEQLDLWPTLAELPPGAQARIQALKCAMISLSGF